MYPRIPKLFPPDEEPPGTLDSVALESTAFPTAPPAAALTDLGMVLDQLLQSRVIRKALAENHDSPPTVLAWLAGDEDEEVRLGVARNQATPANALTQLAANWLMRLSLANNPSTPSFLLTELAQEWNSEVRRAVASNPGTPPDVLEKLARDPDSWVCQKVARNPGTPPATLSWLAKDKDPSIHRSLAQNPCTPLEVQKQLAGSDDPVVRKCLTRLPIYWQTDTRQAAANGAQFKDQSPFRWS